MRLRRPRWSFLTWLIIGLVVPTLVLGIVGYWTVGDDANAGPAFQKDMQASPHLVGRVFDVLYDSLCLLLLGAKNTYGNPYLMIGRWFGMAMTFLAVIKLVSARMGRWLRDFRIRHLGLHTVVIGLGVKGASFARAAAAVGPVVIVDPREMDSSEVDPGDAVHPVFALRANVAAQDDDSLRLVGLSDAALIVLTTGNDAVNLAIARRLVHRLGTGPRRHSQDVEILIHVADAGLRVAGLSDVVPVPNVVVRPFSEPALAVRRLFADWRPAVLARVLGASAMHLVLIGLDAYTEEVALQAVRMCPLPGQGRTELTVFVPDPQVARQDLLRRFPALAALCTLEFRSFDHRADFAAEELHAVEGPQRDRRVTAVFVSASTDAEALMVTRRLRLRTVQHRCWLAPIFVRLRRAEDAAGALFPIDATKWLARAIEPFGDVASSCTRDGLDDLNERRAQRLHEAYVAEGKTAASTRNAATMCPWNELAEESRESNRRAVDHFALKLAALGFLLPNGAPRLDAPLNLTARELEGLARFEHESWSAEKLLAGWRPGERRDQSRRIHEWLRPFEQLGEVRQRDLSQIQVLNTISSEGPVAGSAVRERRIGLVGHNVLTSASAHRVAAVMREVLTTLEDLRRREGRGAEVWSFVTPLAPGSDLTLARAVTEILGAAGAEGSRAPAFRIIVPQVLSFEDLALAYLDTRPPPGSVLDHQSSLAEAVQRNGGSDPVSAIAEVLRHFVLSTPACRLVVDLPAPDPALPANRAAALAAVDAYLLETCDELIAVLDPARYGVSGAFAAQAWPNLPDAQLPPSGTGALVKAWLRRPAREGLHARAPLFPAGLHVISP